MFEILLLHISGKHDGIFGNIWTSVWAIYRKVPTIPPHGNLDSVSLPSKVLNSIERLQRTVTWCRSARPRSSINAWIWFLWLGAIYSSPWIIFIPGTTVASLRKSAAKFKVRWACSFWTFFSSFLMIAGFSTKQSKVTTWPRNTQGSVASDSAQCIWNRETTSCSIFTTTHAGYTLPFVINTPSL